MAEHTLKINAELDTSGLQGRLDQLNQQKQRAPGASGNSGAVLANQLTKLDRTLANLTRAVNQLAAGQKASGGIGPAPRGPVVLKADGGLKGLMLIPQMKRRTVTKNLMRDAVASQIKFLRENSQVIFGGLSPDIRRGY